MPENIYSNFSKRYTICSQIKSEKKKQVIKLQQPFILNDITKENCKDIVVAVHVKDRDIYLERSLKNWSLFPFKKIVVVNWQINDTVTKELCSKFESVEYYQIIDDGWSRAEARNIKIALCQHDGYILATDCDILLMDTFLSEIILPKDIVHFVGNLERNKLATSLINEGIFGTCLLTKAQYMAVNGCNENMKGWGWEDDDLHHKLGRNFRYAYLPFYWFYHQEHSNELRSKYQKEKDIKISRIENIKIQDRTYDFLSNDYAIKFPNGSINSTKSLIGD